MYNYCLFKLKDFDSVEITSFLIYIWYRILHIKKEYCRGGFVGTVKARRLQKIIFIEMVLIPLYSGKAIVSG